METIDMISQINSLTVGSTIVFILMIVLTLILFIVETISNINKLIIFVIGVLIVAVSIGTIYYLDQRISELKTKLINTPFSQETCRFLLRKTLDTEALEEVLFLKCDIIPKK